jgi:hypothetical protein
MRMQPSAPLQMNGDASPKFLLPIPVCRSETLAVDGIAYRLTADAKESRGL